MYAKRFLVVITFGILHQIGADILKPPKYISAKTSHFSKIASLY